MQTDEQTVTETVAPPAESQPGDVNYVGASAFFDDKDEEVAEKPGAEAPAGETPPANEPQGQDPASEKKDEDEDDWFSDGDVPPTPVPSTALMQRLSQKFGVEIEENETEDAFVAKLEKRFEVQQALSADPEYLTGEQLLKLNDRQLLEHEFRKNMGEGKEFEDEQEVQDEIDRLAEEGKLERRANRIRNEVKSEITAKEQQTAQTVEANRIKMAKMAEDFNAAVRNLEVAGVKIPAKHAAEIQQYIASGQYLRDSTGANEKGEPVAANEYLETVMWTNKNFRTKILNKIKEEHGKKVLSDWIAQNVENRGPSKTPGATAGLPAKADRLLGANDFFG